MVQLTYPPKVINEIEVEHNHVQFMTVFSNTSYENIKYLVRKGMPTGTSLADAETEIMQYFSEGGDISKLYLIIMESLQASGFLDREMDLKKMAENKAKSRLGI